MSKNTGRRLRVYAKRVLAIVVVSALAGCGRLSESKACELAKPEVVRLQKAFKNQKVISLGDCSDFESNSDVGSASIVVHFHMIDNVNFEPKDVPDARWTIEFRRTDQGWKVN